MAKDDDMGFEVEGVKEHPVLIVGGTNVVGGPVRVAPGSGTRTPPPGSVRLPVWPQDCEPHETLSKATWFVLNEVRAVPQRVLYRRVGKVVDSKLQEMRSLLRGMIP